MFMWVWVCVHTVCICAHVCPCVYVCVGVDTCACVYRDMFVYGCVCVCAHVFISAPGSGPTSDLDLLSSVDMESLCLKGQACHLAFMTLKGQCEA